MCNKSSLDCLPKLLDLIKEQYCPNTCNKFKEYIPKVDL